MCLQDKISHILDSDERHIPRDKYAFGVWNKTNSHKLRGMNILMREKLYYIECVCTGCNGG